MLLARTDEVIEQAAGPNRLTDFTCARMPAAVGGGDRRRDRRGLRARSFSLWHRGESADARGVLPLRERPRRDPPADDGGRSLSARGAGDGKGVTLTSAIERIPDEFARANYFSFLTRIGQ
jgi:hypothetical protein